MAEILRYLGLAEEASYAVEPQPTPQIFVDLASASLDVPGDTEITAPGAFGRQARIQRPGFYAPEGNIVYAWDVRTIAFLLKWALGGYVYTAGPPKKHECYGSTLSTLPSFCARLGKDIFEHGFSGCVINSLELTVEDAYCEASAEIIAAKDFKAAIRAASSVTLPTEYPLAFHEVSVSLAGSDKTAKVKTLQLTINNNVDAEGGRSLGSRFPRAMRAGERTTEFQIGMDFDDTAELERFWGGATGPAVAGGNSFATLLTFNGAGTDELIISLPNCKYSQPQQQPSGRDVLLQQLTAKAYTADITLADAVTHVSSEILATVHNAEGAIGPAA